MEIESDVAKALWKSITSRVKARGAIKKKARVISWSKDLVEEIIIISSSSEEEVETEGKEWSIKSPTSMEEGVPNNTSMEWRIARKRRVR